MTTHMHYAVLFKAFVIDDFVKRRLASIAAAAPLADVYLLIDETNGSFGPIPFDRVIRYRETDLLALGFAPHSQGSLFWYNADYPLYYFQHLYPNYEMIVMVEYDAVTNISLDGMAQECQEKGFDFVAEPITKTLETYWWTNTMSRFYSREQIRPYLICVAVFSARAVRYLAECRLRQGRAYDLPDAAQWPVGESFVGTELALGGFRMSDLSAFGKLTRYDWWPPIHEAELPGLAGDAFIHPVLIGSRYVKSLFKNTFITGVVVVVKFTMAGLGRAARRGAARMVASSIRSAAKRR